MRLFGPNIKKMKANCDVKGLIEALSYTKGSAVKMREVTVALAKIGAPAVVPLIAALNDKDEQVRAGAAEALELIGDARAVEPLSAALKDEVREVRLRAADALGRLKDPRAVEPLVAALKDEYWHVRLRAASALGRLKDPRAVEPLIAALKDENMVVRGDTASALGEIKDPRAVEPLIAALKDEEMVWRFHVADALGEIGDARAIEPLSAALKDEDEQVREHATMALKRIVEPPEKYEVRVRIEGYRSQGNVNGLIHILEDKELDYDLVETVREALMGLGTDAMLALFLALGDNERIAGMNQLQREGRLNDAMIQLAIGKAVSDYRRNFSV